MPNEPTTIGNIDKKAGKTVICEAVLTLIKICDMSLVSSFINASLPAAVCVTFKIRRDKNLTHHLIIIYVISRHTVLTNLHPLIFNYLTVFFH